MATIQINIPDELAQTAASAGLLTAEAVEAMLREQLRRRADQQQALFDKIMQLPPQRMAQVVDFIDFLRARNDKQHLNPAASQAGGDAFTTDDPTFGMWRDREDMADVAGYVRKIREPRFNDDGTRRE